MDHRNSTASIDCSEGKVMICVNEYMGRVRQNTDMFLSLKRTITKSIDLPAADGSSCYTLEISNLMQGIPGPTYLRIIS